MTKGQIAYREFLKSDFWKALSKQKREKIGRCQKCRSKTFLQCHHHRYPDDWYDTTENDLSVLCRKCHRKAHGRVYQFYMLYRDDERFSKHLHRIECLIMRIMTKEKPLRLRDEKFLDRALQDYPPEPKDTCMQFKVGLCREWNRKLVAGEFNQ